MKKILTLIGLITSIYATPPCQYESDKVCVYLYKGGMSAEANLVNTTMKKVQIIEVEANLDGTYRQLTNFEMQPNQTITLLKSRYNDATIQPNLSHAKVTYKIMQ